jgi:hypothetical protein
MAWPISRGAAATIPSANNKKLSNTVISSTALQTPVGPFPKLVIVVDLETSSNR